MQSLVEFIIIKVKKEIGDQNVIDIKNFNLAICVFIYIKYFDYLNRREDKYLKTKHMIARIILVFFSFYILFLANSWQDVLWYGFGLVSLTLIVMIVYLFMKWYTNQYQ